MDESLDGENVEDIQRRFEQDFLPRYGDMWRKIIEEQVATAPPEAFLQAIQSGKPMSFQVHSNDKDCECDDCADPVLEWENPSTRDNDDHDSESTETEEEFEAPRYSDDEESYTGPGTPLAEGFQETFGNFGFGDASPPRFLPDKQSHHIVNSTYEREEATALVGGYDENVSQNQVTPESDSMEKYNISEGLPRTIRVSASPEIKRTPQTKNEKDKQQSPPDAYSYENESSQSFASAQPYQSDNDGTPQTPSPNHEHINEGHEQLFSPQPNPQFTPTHTQNGKAEEVIDYTSPSSQSSASSGFHMDLSYLVVSPKQDNNEQSKSQGYRDDVPPPMASAPAEQTPDSAKVAKENQINGGTICSDKEESKQSDPPASDFDADPEGDDDAQAIVGASDDDSFDEGPVVRPTPNRRRIVVDSSDEEDEPIISQTSRTGRTRPRRAQKKSYFIESSDESSEEHEMKSDSSEASFDSPDELSLDGIIQKKFTNMAKSDDDYTDENQHPNTMKMKGKSGQSFKKDRVQLSLQYFSYYNQKAFDGALAGVDITWSNKLRTTAGLTRLRKSYQAFGPDAVPDRKATIELSSKVLDNEERLQSTLLHEMVHAAAWLVDGVSKPPHGDCFKKWAKCAMRRIPGMKVTTTHDYEIQFKYAWACTAPGCKFIVKRHSRSVDPKRHCCGRCRSKLVEVDLSGKDGSKAPTVKKPTELSGYNLFVKEQSAGVRRRLMEARKAGGDRNPKVSQPEVMKECAKLWKAKKSLQT